MKLYIDADYIVYKGCAAAETEIDWGSDVIMVTSKFSRRTRTYLKTSSIKIRESSVV